MSPDRPPTPEQRAAIDARDRDVFLEAGAGTGKTRVLVERYCEAVDADGVDVEGILAFTFTERAAAELRERVRRRLGERAREAREAGDAERAIELGRSARATERAWVTTIHGFCRRLLASHPIVAGLDPRFRVLDQAEADRLRERAFNEALAELLEAGSAEVAHAAAAYKPYRLAEMALGAHARLRSQGMDDPRLPPVSDAVRSAADDGETPPLSPAEAEAATIARAALEALLEGFHRRYQRLRADRSGLDFADLELRALALLRESASVREAWQGRFAHILVDEFQDTNAVQLDLVEALRGTATRLFVVGDEHQSIYRFRNADLEVFRAERRAAVDEPGTEVLALRGNFRSRPAPLAAVNTVGAALLERFAPLTWGRPTPEEGPPGGSAELLLTLDEGRAKDAANWRGEEIALGGPPSETQPQVVAEARFLARRLRELVDAGECERGDIVVLLRAFTHVDAYEEALQRAGLEPYVVGGRGYWSQQQVEDLVRLLGCVANPLDDELLFGALASPAASVSPDALWLLRRAAGSHRHVWPLIAWGYGEVDGEPGEIAQEWLDEIPSVDADRLRRFCRILGPLRAEAPLLPLEALVDRTMTAFGYDLALLARPGGRGRMANVRKLMRLAREFERHEGRDLAAFLLAAAESATRDEREGMAAVRAEDHDGVRVMTVHAAKGLQFPVVAVPDLGRGLSAGHGWSDVVIGRRPREGHGDQPFGMRLVFPTKESFGLWELVSLNREDRDATAEESCRLTYVAATRAEDRLILSGCYGPGDLERGDPEHSDSALARLLPDLAAAGWAGGDATIELPAPKRAEGADPAEPRDSGMPLAIRVSAPGVERAEWLRERLAPGLAAKPPVEGGPPPILAGRPRGVPVGHLSYSALAEYERCGYRFYVERVLHLGSPMSAAVPEEAEEQPVEPAPDELVEPPAPDAPAVARARPLAIGNVVHKALEWSAGRGWQPPPADLLARLLAGEGLAADAEAAERVRGAVDGWLSSPLLSELDGWRVRPEVPFVLPLAGSVVRGQIDLLAEGPAGERWVIDFKTDTLRGRDAAELAGRYAAQRRVYALAAASGADSVRAIHLFLDAPGEPVAEEFREAELAAARAELERLHRRIQDGEFEVTESPTSAICFGCPAAARLCPRPKWRPPAPPGAPAPGVAEGVSGALDEPAAAVGQATLFE